MREYSLSKTAVVSEVKDQSKGSLFVFTITWGGAETDDHDKNNEADSNSRIGISSSSGGGGAVRTVRISSSDAPSSDAESRAVSPTAGGGSGNGNSGGGPSSRVTPTRVREHPFITLSFGIPFLIYTGLIHPIHS